MSGIGSRWLFASGIKSSWTKLTNSPKSYSTKTVKTKTVKRQCGFGLLVDIDGVIVRGNKLIPGSKEAFHELLTRGEWISLTYSSCIPPVLVLVFAPFHGSQPITCATYLSLLKELSLLSSGWWVRGPNHFLDEWRKYSESWQGCVSLFATQCRNQRKSGTNEMSRWRPAIMNVENTICEFRLVTVNWFVSSWTWCGTLW